MVKTILVCIDGSEHARAATAAGFWLAEKLNAVVVGMHVVDIVSIDGPFLHDISGSLGFEPYFDLSSKMREALHQRGQVLLETFSKEATDRGIRSDTFLATGVIANEIAERAKLSDLVIMGLRGQNDRFSTGLLGSTGESVSRKCPKPVLLTPSSFVPPTNPLLAYDGSMRASAAMQAAAELCSALRLPLTVLTVHREEEPGRRLLAEAGKYLEPHGLEVLLELQQTGSAPERISNFAREREHDLLFIGAYGHGRIIEMVLGSTTEYVLRNADCPVFLNR